MKLILQSIKALFRKIEASRTHWEEVKEVSVIAETTVTIPEGMGSERLPDTTPLTVGQTYFVILNGVSYKCVAWYSDDEGGVIIGNGAIYGGEGGGNGEPFSCDSYSGGDFYLNTDKAGTYTISVSTEENVIHKLDKKYLPDEVIDDITSKMDANNPVGTGSFSMGRKPDTVVGSNSHAEGSNTTASGNCSHAEGLYTTASGACCHAEGNMTTASSHYSHAEGQGTTASMDYAHAEGSGTTASGYDSHAEGFRTAASGDDSHAEGYSSNEFSSVVTATNPTNTAIINAWKGKKFSLAKGTSSHVEGKDSLALGDYSHAEGQSTTALGSSSHAEGNATTASAAYSHAEGRNTTASGGDSHAEGYRTTASGDNSHAEGNSTTASGDHSHSEGSDTTASGNYSHAEGSNTATSGGCSHAEGLYTTASGNYSHAEGYWTKASGAYQHAQGKYNIEDSAGTYADIIGNGAGDSTRSNAATVDWSGNAWYAGDVYVGSTSGTNKDAGSKKLATEEYVNSAVSGIPSGGDIPAALPNPYALTFTGAVTGSYDGSQAVTVEIPSGVTDDHINSLIDTKLGVIENGSY